MSEHNIFNPTHLAQPMSKILLGERPLTPPEDRWIPLVEYACFHHGGPLPTRPKDHNPSVPWPPRYFHHDCHYCSLQALCDAMTKVIAHYEDQFTNVVEMIPDFSDKIPLARSVMIQNAFLWLLNNTREKCGKRIQQIYVTWVETWGAGKDKGLTQTFLDEARCLGSEHFDS